MITASTAYRMCIGEQPFDKPQMLEFVQHAPARELQEFYLLGRDKFGIAGAFNRDWLEQAVVSMHVRIGEDNIAAANGIVKQLIEQTDILVTESRKLNTLTEQLSNQNRILIAESKQVRWLTWGLLLLTAALLVYTVYHG
jgi:hypothetical protein